jgi:hypothetical protein
MSQSEMTDRVTLAAENQGAAKMPYDKPAFRHESVFETSALSCGKVQNTQSSCRGNRKVS